MNFNKYRVTQPWNSYAKGSEDAPVSSFFLLPDMAAKLRVDIDPEILQFGSNVFNLDCIITRITDRFVEFEKLTSYIGPYFSHTFYGKAPVMLNIEGYFFQTKNNDAKHRILWVYNKVFKMSAVAQTGVTPTLAFYDSFITGAFTNLVLSENSQDENLIHFIADFFVLNSSYISLDETMGSFSTLHVDYSSLTRFKSATFKNNFNTPGNNA